MKRNFLHLAQTLLCLLIEEELRSESDSPFHLLRIAMALTLIVQLIVIEEKMERRL